MCGRCKYFFVSFSFVRIIFILGWMRCSSFRGQGPWIVLTFIITFIVPRDFRETCLTSSILKFHSSKKSIVLFLIEIFLRKTIWKLSDHPPWQINRFKAQADVSGPLCSQALNDVYIQGALPSSQWLATCIAIITVNMSKLWHSWEIDNTNIYQQPWLI